MKTQYLVKQLIGTTIFFVLIFVSAGKINYWPGLVYVGIGLGMFIVSHTLLRPDSDLLSERSKPGQGSKNWDKKILLVSFLATIGMYVVAGLDSGRYHWSPQFSTGLHATGIILTIAGQLMFLVAQKQNRYFSSTVRIQTDRGHTVCDTGLYKLVRHPAYLSSVIQAAGFPLLFGSLWSIIPSGSIVVLHIIRTLLEDRALVDELTGYQEYTTKTRFRLLPGIW